MFSFAMFMSLCVDVVCVGRKLYWCVGLSDAFMLNSVGDRTPLCGTQFLNLRCVGVLFLNVVYALRHLM